MNSRNNYCHIYTSSTDICRMPWYLIERKEHDTFYELFDISMPFNVVHVRNLMGISQRNLYVDRYVSFKGISSLDEGEIILAADNKMYVDRYMQQLMENNDASTELDVDVDYAHFRCLIAYKQHKNLLSFAIVKRKQIIWPAEIASQEGKVLIQIEGQQYLAKIVAVHASETVLRERLTEIHTRCINEWPFNSKKLLHRNPWILVQYYSSPWNLHQIIVKLNDTVWLDENPYTNTTAYISDGSAIYVGEIIRRSNNYDDLAQKLLVFAESFQVDTLESKYFPAPEQSTFQASDLEYGEFKRLLTEMKNEAKLNTTTENDEKDFECLNESEAESDIVERQSEVVSESEDTDDFIKNLLQRTMIHISNQ